MILNQAMKFLVEAALVYYPSSYFINNIISIQYCSLFIQPNFRWENVQNTCYSRQ